MALQVSLSADLFALATPIIEQAANSGFSSSLQAGDVSLWGPDAQPEASIRLGWVENPLLLEDLVIRILELKSELSGQGIDRFVLCGMGGSSLAPEVMTQCAGVELGILDSTHPDVVHRFVSRDLSRTAVIVSSKSGGTLETDSQLRAFEQAFVNQGFEPNTRIIVVTDPDSPLEQRAKDSGYSTFIGNPQIGGRFSALSAFGLVPSGLAGVDISRIISDAARLWPELGADSSSNPGLMLGAGRAVGCPRVNKVLLRTFTQLPGLGDWVEQLVAESTGKDRKGLLPVVDSKLGVSDSSTADCVSVGDSLDDAHIQIQGSLGEHFLLWQYATAFVGALLQVNPFDQPNVESAKTATWALLESSNSAEVNGEKLIVGGTLWARAKIPETVHSVADALEWVFSLIGPRSYLALCIFGDSTQPDRWVKAREHLEKKLHRPVTLGFGPRFLHSTGQFHKGGPHEGVFLSIIEPATHAVQIPGRSFGFGELLVAQARGDRQVLAATGQPTISLVIDDTAHGDVTSLLRGL